MRTYIGTNSVLQYNRKQNHLTEVIKMALSNLFAWNNQQKNQASTACGAGDKPSTACGADDKPQETPTACGSACGAGDKPQSACGTACGAGDKE